MQSKGEKTFGHILSFDLKSFDITLPTFGKPVNISLIIAKKVCNFHTPDDCVNPKSLGDLSDRKVIIDKFLEGQPLNPDYLAFLRIGITFFSLI